MLAADWDEQFLEVSSTLVEQDLGWPLLPALAIPRLFFSLQAVRWAREETKACGPAGEESTALHCAGSSLEGEVRVKGGIYCKRRCCGNLASVDTHPSAAPPREEGGIALFSCQHFTSYHWQREVRHQPEE